MSYLLSKLQFDLSKKKTSAHGLHSRFEGLGNNCFTHCLPHRGIHVHICLLARDPVKRRADSHFFWPLGLPGSEDWGSIWSLQFPASRTGCKVVSRWFFAALCTVNMFQLYSHLGRCHVWKRVCLKIGYIPNYSHLIGIMIINHWPKV